MKMVESLTFDGQEIMGRPRGTPVEVSFPRGSWRAAKVHEDRGDIVGVIYENPEHNYINEDNGVTLPSWVSRGRVRLKKGSKPQ